MDAPAARLFVFDFDGTLADTWRDIASALDRTLEEAGLPGVQGPEVRFWIGNGVLPLLERAVPGPWRTPERLDELYVRFRDHYEAKCLETTEVYPGVVDCLEELSGEHLAIVSNKPSRFLDLILGSLGLKPYFGVVLGGDSVPVRKPDPAVLRHVVDTLAGPVGEVWMIGDSAVDIETGRAFGARTVGCVWGFRGREELCEAGAETLAETPRDLLRIIRQPA
ncbi:MAG: HAD-IA family hydrolase [Myxococcota bacterium]